MSQTTTPPAKPVSPSPAQPAPQQKAPVTPATAGPAKPQTVTPFKPADFQISPVGALHNWFKALIYGPYGCGKTTLCASSVEVPEMRDVFMINAESGTMSIEHAPHIPHGLYIDQVRVKDFKTVALVQEFLKNHCIARDANNIALLKVLQQRTFRHKPERIEADPEYRELDQYEQVDEADTAKLRESGEHIEYRPDESGYFMLTKARLRRFRTAIIDSLAEVDTFSMYQLLGIKTDMKLDDDMDVAEWAEFRKNNQLMQLLVRAYRDLPMHILMVTGNKFTQDERKQFHWTPTLTGQLANQTQGFVDMVGYIQIGKPLQDRPDYIPRRLMIQPVGNFDAKSRMAHFKAPFIDDPDMKKIMEIFRGNQIKQAIPAPKAPQVKK